MTVSGRVHTDRSTPGIFFFFRFCIYPPPLVAASGIPTSGSFLQTVHGLVVILNQNINVTSNPRKPAHAPGKHQPPSSGTPLSGIHPHQRRLSDWAPLVVYNYIAGSAELLVAAPNLYPYNNTDSTRGCISCMNGLNFVHLSRWLPTSPQPST